MDLLKIAHTLSHILLIIVIILFIFTGFGITNYQIIEAITLGALPKLTSYQIHLNLIIPFLILLGTHFGFIIRKKYQKKP
jgi:ABC-type uncharacterized transport system permease subunit